MNLKETLKALLAEAGELQSKKSDDLTPEDVARIPVLTAEINETRSKIKAQETAAANLKGAITDADQTTYRPSAEVSLHGSSRAEKAAGFAAAFKTQVRDQIGTKAMVPNQIVTIDYSAPLVVEPKPALTLLSLVSFDSTELPPSGAYLRQTLRENNATTVPAGERKPTSRYGMDSVPWEVATIAHLTEPIRKQWLQDFSQLEPWLSVELAYGLTEALQTLMLDGGRTDGGATVAGLETIAGVNQQPFVGNMFRSIRLALGNLETAGVLANGIDLHPDDWTEVELAEDANDRPLTTPLLGDARGRYLWNTPVVVSPQVDKGTAWVGDWKSIVLGYRGPVEMKMTDKGVYEEAPVAPATEPTLLDLYEHNLLRARAEMRAVFQFLHPASLTKVQLTD